MTDRELLANTPLEAARNDGELRQIRETKPINHLLRKMRFHGKLDTFYRIV